MQQRNQQCYVMTDTDDTDELLLIPPDFFVESDSGHSETIKPYYNIVSNLIKQVDSLQNRLNSIESIESYLSNSVDYTETPTKMDIPKPNFRKFNSVDELYSSYSAQNTPQKPVSKFKLNSLPNSPNIDRIQSSKNLTRGLDSRLVVNSPPDSTNASFTQVRKDGQMLNEIDTFLSKVKTIQRINAVRNLENDFNSYGVIKNDQKLQDPQKTFESPISLRRTWKSGDNKESVPDYGAGIRNTLYSKEQCRDEEKYSRHCGDSQPTAGDFNTDQRNNLYDQNRLKNEVKHSTYTQNSRSTCSHYNDQPPSFEKHSSDSSSDCTQPTVYTKARGNKTNLLTNPIHSNALNILHMHKKLLEESSTTDNKETSRDHKRRNRGTIVGDNFGGNLGLMNLADIWNGGNTGALTTSHLTQKLEEEKYRRKHCEDMIQELQTKNLEMQQKLSVAVKVDDVKNKTIQQFHEALEKVVFKLEKLNKEKFDQEFELNKLKNQRSDEKEEADQKISYFEKEVSKALNMAQANHDKSQVFEKKCLELETENQSMRKKMETIEDSLAKEREKYKQISDILAQKEIEINENKNALSNAKAEISQSRKILETCQMEFNKIKEEYVKLDSKLKEERTQTVNLNKEIMNLLKDNELGRKRETDLQAEVSKLKKQMESNKVELRNFYQGQVEILVQNKLKEFQYQMDQTENNFKEEVKKREMTIAKSAASHIQQISEKYSLEIKLLEKKHQEEIKLYQIQLMQHKQHADNVQNKLDQFQEKRVTIAKQLQKVMESQWNEALRIITNGKSPTFQDESAFNAIDQLNSLKTKSYTNLEEVLSQQNDEDFNMMRRTHAEQEETVSTNSNKEKPAYDRFEQPAETPVSSKLPLNRRALTECDLQKYINLLLNKPMGNPSNQGQEEKAMELDHLQLDANERLYFQDNDGSRTHRGHSKERRGPKPPWK